MKKTPPESGISFSAAILSATQVEYRIHRNLTLKVPRFEVRRGEIVGLLGPNGAGKTTLLNLLTGIVEPQQGKIRLHDRDIREQSALELAAQRSVMRASHIQDAAQGLTVREIIALGSIANPLHPRLAHVLVASLAHRFDLVDLLQADFTFLSSGEKQRVHAARIFLQLYGREEGHLVFLDEPYAHLDVRHTQILAREILSLRKAGAGIVVVLHDINFAAQHCDRVCFVKEAQLVGEAAGAGIYDAGLLTRVYEMPFTILKSGRSRYVVQKF